MGEDPASGAQDLQGKSDRVEWVMGETYVGAKLRDQEARNEPPQHFMAPERKGCEALAWAKELGVEPERLPSPRTNADLPYHLSLGGCARWLGCTSRWIDDDP